jgi:ABC-type dipeptide/oligopeptide/nickel transport system permease subunit
MSQIETVKEPPPPPGPEREFTVRSRSQGEMVLRRFLHHKLAVGSIVVLLLVVLVALFGGRFWHYGYTFQSNDLSQGPSLRHPFGTDELGRDTFARVLRGANKSVVIALMVAFLSTGFGALVGALAGFYRGWVDGALMRATDLALTLPVLAVAGALAYQFGGRNNGWVNLALILAAFYWQPIARVVRGVFLSLREKEYVEAARALGAGNGRIMFRHLLPNAVGPVIVNATLVVALAILAETALSYIGLGIQPPDTSLGQLVAQGQQAATTRPWLFYFPGLFIIVIVLTINFVGDGLRDAFDPTQTRVRA